jgi:hypothetical protein
MAMKVIAIDQDSRKENHYLLRVNYNQMRHLLAVLLNARRYTPRIEQTVQLHESLRNMTYEISHAIDGQPARLDRESDAVTD